MRGVDIKHSIRWHTVRMAYMYILMWAYTICLQVAPEHLHMIMDVIVDDCILAAVCVGIRVPTPTETDRRVRQVRDLIVRQLHDNDRHKAT